MHTSHRSILAIAAIALGVAASVCASHQNRTPAPAASDKPAQTSDPSPDLGSIAGNVYTNDSLGMVYEFPKSWFVDHSWMDMQNKPQDVGPRPTDPDQVAKYDSMVAMKKGTHALLAVSQRPPDAAKESGPRIQFTVSPALDNTNGDDILNGMKSMYGRMRLVQVVGDPEDYTFGGQAFSRLDMRLLDVILRGGAGFQSAVIGVRSRQYLQFLILANSQEQLDSLVHSLDSLRFK